MIITYKLIIFITVVFILLWLFIRTIDERKWLTFLLTVILTPIVYFYLFYPLINIFSNYHHEKYFNAEIWQEKPSLRYEMIDNLLEKKIALGKTKSEIEDLFGTFEWLSWDDANKMKLDDKWNYNLGFKPGAFNHMQECIELTFRNAKVETIKQYQIYKEFE